MYKLKIEGEQDEGLIYPKQISTSEGNRQSIMKLCIEMNAIYTHLTLNCLLNVTIELGTAGSLNV